MKKTQSAEFASVAFAIASLLSKILGFVRDLFLSNYFGVSKSVDALSATLPINSIFQNIMTSAVVVSFIPLYLEEISIDKEKAKKELSTTFNIIMLLFFIATFLLIIFSQQLVSVFVPGFKDELTQNLTSKLIDFVSFSGFLWAIVGFLYGLSQLHKHFLITAIMPLFINVSIILGLVLFHNTLGIYSYVLGLILGLLIQAGVMLYYSKKYLGLEFSLNFNPKGTFLGKLFILSIPLILLQLTNYFVNVIANRIASHLAEGSIASIQYANKLRQLWVSLLTVPIATAYYPYLSEMSTKKDTHGLNRVFNQSMQFSMILGLPITLVSFFFANPIVRIVFERGAFGSTAVNLTTVAFKYFSIGIFALMITTISLRVLYSMKEMYLAFFVSLLVAAINVTLFYPMVNAMGHAGIPLAISIGLIIEAVIFVLSLKVKTRIALRGFFDAIVKIGVASFVSIGIMYAVYLILNRVLNFGKLGMLVNFALASFVFVLVYIPTLKILKVEEVQKIVKLIRKGN